MNNFDNTTLLVEGYTDSVDRELRPVCSNDTKAGQACNRRVEIMIVPK